MKKTKGRTTGWIGYTWSKTTRQFDSINNGISFPAKYDRRHDLSIVATYNLSKKWTLSGVFDYATGNTVTLPNERYIIVSNARKKIVNSYSVKSLEHLYLEVFRESNNEQV